MNLPTIARGYFSEETVANYLGRWVNSLREIQDFSALKLEQVLRDLSEELGIKPVVLIHPTRLALSGVTGGPPLFEMMELLGGDECVKRLGKAISFILKKLTKKLDNF